MKSKMKLNLHVSKGVKKKYGSPIKVAKTTGNLGAKVTLDNLEGGKEIEDALIVTYGITNPLIKPVNKAASVLKEKALEDLLKERKRKIKVVEAGKRTLSHKARRLPTSAIKKANKETSKKLAKETTKTLTKEGAKVATSTGASLAGGPVGGFLLGKAIGLKLDEIDIKNTNRNRKIAFILDKIKTGDKQKDSLGKMIKDLIIKKVGTKMRQVVSIGIPSFFALFLLVAVACVPVVGSLAIIYNSPFALFFPPLDGGESVMSVTSGLMEEFNKELADLVNNHAGYDEVNLVYIDYEGSSASPSNYYDVLCIYMVKHGIGDTASLMNDKSKENLRNIFNKMCSYTRSVTTEVIEDDDGIETRKTILNINVVLKTYKQMEIEYNFTEEEKKILEEMMNPANLALIGYTDTNSESADGGNSKSSLSSEEISLILGNITDEKIKTTCFFALSKVGYPYSQAYRDTGNYFDCSSLVYYSYKSAGINISHGGATTAAEEAKGLDLAGKTVSFNEIKAGDLIFYSYANNGRYKNISHVAIYVGNGKIVEALNERVGVIYRDVKLSSIVMVGRPN